MLNFKINSAISNFLNMYTQPLSALVLSSLKCGRLRKYSPRSFLVISDENNVTDESVQLRTQETVDASCKSATGGLPRSKQNLY